MPLSVYSQPMNACSIVTVRKGEVTVFFFLLSNTGPRVGCSEGVGVIVTTPEEGVMPAGGAAPATALISASVNSTGSDKPSSFAIFDDIEASSRLVLGHPCKLRLSCSPLLRKTHAKRTPVLSQRRPSVRRGSQFPPC